MNFIGLHKNKLKTDHIILLVLKMDHNGSCFCKKGDFRNMSTWVNGHEKQPVKADLYKADPIRREMKWSVSNKHMYTVYVFNKGGLKYN